MTPELTVETTAAATLAGQEGAMNYDTAARDDAARSGASAVVRGDGPAPSVMHEGSMDGVTVRPALRRELEGTPWLSASCVLERDHHANMHVSRSGSFVTISITKSGPDAAADVLTLVEWLTSDAGRAWYAETCAAPIVLDEPATVTP